MNFSATAIPGVLFVKKLSSRFAVGFTLKQQKYSLRPTRYGIVFLVMIGALFIGSINHNNNLEFLLTFLLAGILLVSLRHTYRNLSGISLSAQHSKPVFAGQEAQFPIRLTATSHARIGITAILDHRCKHSFDIPDNRHAQIIVPFPTKKRGLLELNALQVATCFPLGLVKIQTRRQVNLSCLVYPAPIATPLMTEQQSDAEETSPAMNDLQGNSEFSGLARYRPGDSLQRVYWKSLARGQGLHTREFAEGSGEGTIFSLEKLMGRDQEKKLAQLCHMVLTAHVQGMTYGMRLGSDRFIAPGKGSAHRNNCLKALALYPQ